MGGLSMRHNGEPGAVIARAMIGDAAMGYSAVVELIDPQKAQTTKLHGTGLRLGRVADEELTPIVVARNTGTTPTIVTGRVRFSTSIGGEWTMTLPDLRLQPGETKLLDTAALVQRSRRRPSIASAGLEFEYTGEPGSVVMSALSVSQSGRQVFRVPLLDPAALPSSTGGYPWSIVDNWATVVYIKNVTDQPQRYILQLTFAGGVYAPGLRTVEAGQTVALDVRALRDHQVPDEQGRTIPRKATRGQVAWSVVGADYLVLIGRAEQADVIGGLSSSYACVDCCPASFYDGWCDPGSATGYPGETTQFTAVEQDQNCYGNSFEPFEVSASWSSQNTSVATVDSGGLATAQDEGSTLIRATWSTFERGETDCSTRPIDVVREALCDVLAPCSILIGGSDVNLTTAECDGGTHRSVISNQMGKNGNPEILGCTGTAMGSNPQITIISCGIENEPGGGRTVTEFTAKKLSGTQDAQIQTCVQFRCPRGTRTEMSCFMVNISCN
jgi:hypothetical protein